MYTRFLLIVVFFFTCIAPLTALANTSNGSWSEPLPNWDTSKFVTTGGSPNSRAFDAYNRKGKGHTGADIGAKTGTPIYAIFGGKVILSTYVKGYGNTIVIKANDGSSFLYAHNKSNLVKTGATVSAGQTIGYVGYTGNAGPEFPHVHLQYHPSANEAALLGYKKSLLLVEMKSSPTIAVADPIAKLRALEGGTDSPIIIPEDTDDEVIIVDGDDTGDDTDNGSVWNGELPTDEIYLLFIDGSDHYDYDTPDGTNTYNYENFDDSSNTSKTCKYTLAYTSDTKTDSNNYAEANTNSNNNSRGSSNSSGSTANVSGILNKVLDGFMNSFGNMISSSVTNALSSLTGVTSGLTKITESQTSTSAVCGASEPNYWIRMWKCFQFGAQSSGDNSIVDSLITVAKTMIKDTVSNLIGNLSPALSSPINTLTNISSRVGGIFGDFMGLFSGKNSDSNNDGTTNPLADTNYKPTKSDSIKANATLDLSAIALKTESTISDEYRFKGILTRTLKNDNNEVDVFANANRFNECSFVNKLYLDIDCDGKIDDVKDFTTQHQSILTDENDPEIFLSEYMEVPELGLHCFAFDIDVSEDITENIEDNNRSNWREFITNFGGNIEESTTNTELPEFTFEVSTYTESGTLVEDWQSGDITISEDEELAFRWNAPEYENCLPFIAPVSYDFVGDIAPISRDTKSENIDVREIAGSYAVQCSLSGDERVKVIKVTTQ